MIELIIVALLIILIIAIAIWIVTGIRNTNCKSCKYSYMKGHCNPQLYCRCHRKYVQDDFICTYYK